MPRGPFRVYAGDGMTVAVGTAFSVRLKKDAVEVVVSEGKVAYSRVADTPAPETVAYVAAGETASFSDKVVIEKIDEAEVDRKLSWTAGKLVFAGASALQRGGRYLTLHRHPVRLRQSGPSGHARRRGIPGG